MLVGAESLGRCEVRTDVAGGAAAGRPRGDDRTVWGRAVVGAAVAERGWHRGDASAHPGRGEQVRCCCRFALLAAEALLG